MQRIRTLEILCVTIVVLTFGTSFSEGQQPSSNPPAAPIPTGIRTGKSAFIANADSIKILGVSDLTYNEFYAAMKSWGRFELVTSPADADLVFEVRFTLEHGRIPAESREVRAMRSVVGSLFPAIRLLIIDPKTHVLMWGVTEFVRTANRDSTARTNFDKAVASIVDDIKELTSTPEQALGASAPSN